MHIRTKTKRTLALLVLGAMAMAEPGNAQPVSSTEANKTVVRRFLAALESGDVGAMNAIRGPSGVMMHGASGDRMSTEAGCPMCDALTERNIEIDVILAEGDLVTVRSTWTGLYSGSFSGLTVSTPRRVRVHYTNIYRVADGRIVENWFVSDRLALAQQLGYTLTPPDGPTP